MFPENSNGKCSFIKGMKAHVNSKTCKNSVKLGLLDRSSLYHRNKILFSYRRHQAVKVTIMALA